MDVTGWREERRKELAEWAQKWPGGLRDAVGAMGVERLVDEEAAWTAKRLVGSLHLGRYRADTEEAAEVYQAVIFARHALRELEESLRRLQHRMRSDALDD